jgi:AraC family transcriptional regulator of adaptative response / DNA-3-methyladenine glycosylase II
LRRSKATRNDGVVLTLGFRPPFDWSAVSSFLAQRALAGVEMVRDGAYLRTASLGRHRGWLRVAPVAAGCALRVEVSTSLTGALLPLSTRLGRLFDLGARPDVIGAHLSSDPILAGRVEQCPSQRVVGAFDAHELAVRAVLGQQVSVAAACTLAARVADRFGEPIETPHAELCRTFPRAATLARASVPALSRLGIPQARCQTLVAVADLFRQRAELFEPGADPGPAIAALQELRGVGEWTAQYIAMRALGWPDAFPAGDLGVRKALGGLKPRAALEHAERWRPWRAYAVMHLWQGAA